MEGEIQGTRAELKELKAMHDDAQISKEAAQSELSKHEKVVLAERKQREIELTKMKKEAEEKKIQHERIERRIVSIVLHLCFLFFPSSVCCYESKMWPEGICFVQSTRLYETQTQIIIPEV